jgi:shikimate kinase
MSVPGVFLVGMMGAGKSTVGKRLATRLGLQFIDIDKELEVRCGTTIPMIFELEGEAGFRKREAALVQELTLLQDVVLATGGGVVTLPENCEMLKSRGAVIYLRATPADLWVRLRRDQHRPMLKAIDARARMEKLLADRIPLYENVAHLTVDTGRRPVTDVLDTILTRLPQAYFE